MKMKLSVLVSSDPNYEDLIVEGYIDDECLLLVNQDRGFDHLEVEVLPQLGGQPRRIDFDVLIDLLQMARKRLSEMRRIPGSGEQST